MTPVSGVADTAATIEPMPRVLCFSTKGSGSNDEQRIVELLADHAPAVFAFDRDNRIRSGRRLLGVLRRERPELVVMEGTGLAGGVAILLGTTLWGIPYIVSSGDAVGPFLALERPWLLPITMLYERTLYRRSAGFVGWTPYLVGRAISFGAPRAATAANWTLFPKPGRDRSEVRAQLGIPEHATVVGIAGSLHWNRRAGYCYGAELVRAIHRVKRDDVCVLVVGGGSGLEHLRELAGAELGRRVFLPGPVPQEAVVEHLLAMDVGSLPQSADEVGALRYTTKISEYMSAGLPMITGEIPLAYDLDDGWIWRIPGQNPWDDTYIAALAQLMQALDPPDLAAHRARVPSDAPIFDAARQRHRIGNLVNDIVAARAS